MNNKQSGIRAFIGISLPTAVREILEDTQFDLMELAPEDSIRWVKPESMHLTLWFLGDGLGPEQISGACDALDRVGQESRTFNLSLDRIGVFKKPRDPRVLWVGVGGQSGTLISIKRRLDDELTPLGWEPEKRRYNPHLTLGYVQDKNAVSKARIPYNSPVSQASWQVSKLHLFRSQKTKKGFRYTKVHTTKLPSTAVKMEE